MPVEVNLLAVEAALLLQAAQSLLQLVKLRPPPLATHPLLPDVLEGQIRFSPGQNRIGLVLVRLLPWQPSAGAAPRPAAAAERRAPPGGGGCV